MRKIELALLLLTATSLAFAQSTEDTELNFNGNVAAVTDYMFRGISQTWGRPAIQGGGDLAMEEGLAAGFWGSSISEKSYPGAAMELDLYASYGNRFNSDWSWRVGFYGYLYPGGNLDHADYYSRSFNTLEANAALTWKWFTLKYNRSLTDYFAIDTEQGFEGDSKGTGYVQLDAILPVKGAWNLALHAGHTNITTRLVTPLPNGMVNTSYSDFSATVKYQLARLWSANLGATYAGNKQFYGRTASFLNPGETRDIGGARVFLMLLGNF